MSSTCLSARRSVLALIAAAFVLGCTSPPATPISGETVSSTRDRAGQQGDRIVLALASPREGDAETDEFQVLGFSPRAEGRRSWQCAFTWYKDRDWLGFPPLEGATFAWTRSEGTARYEILVP